MNRKTRNTFDNFDRAQKFVIGWIIFSAVLGLSLLGAAVFVVYKILAHFGIL